MKKLGIIIMTLCLCVLCGCQSQKDVDQVEKITKNKVLEVGGFEKIKLDIEKPDEIGGGKLVLTYGKTKTEVSEYCEFFKTSYALIHDQTIYLFIQAGYSNDYVTTSVYVCKEKDKQLTFMDTYGAALISKDLSSTNIRFVYRLDLFGSYEAYKIYKLQKNEIVEKDEYYYFTNTPELTLIKDLPCHINKKQTTISKDQKIKLIKTDGYQKMYFKCGQQQGYFEFEPTDDAIGQSIQGIKETEYFKDLPYAG